MALPNARRVDVCALLPDGAFAVLEVKSCARDYLADTKWPEYREFCDQFFFVVDLDFPRDLLPADAGLIVAEDAGSAVLVCNAPVHPLPGARRRALLLRYARVAGGRLAALLDPAGAAELQVALSSE
jgi:hypothetical protein